LSDSAVFDFLCEQVERHARLSRLEARGTVRLMLKAVGLDAATLGKGAAILTIDRFLDKELRVRGVADAEQVKSRVLQALRDSKLHDPQGDDAASIFSRITFRR